MIITIIKGVAKELKKILESSFFWSINILFLILMILLFIYFLPFNTGYSIEAFLIGSVFVRVLVFAVSTICLYLTEGIRRNSPGVRTESATISEYLVKSFSLVFIIIIIIFPYYPLGILVTATGSLSFTELYSLFPRLLISGISFSWLGFLIKAWFRKLHRRYISAFIKIVWAAVLLLTFFWESSGLYIVGILIYFCFIFSSFMFAILLYWTYRKKKKGRG